MAEKVISYKVTIINEAGEQAKVLASDFSTLKKSVSDLEKELENTDFGSEQFQNLQKELKNSKGALEQAQASTQSLSEKFAGIPGPLGGAIQSVQGLSKAFLALIANPVGAVITAIVLAVTTLYKAFTSTKEGGEQLDRVMAGLSAVFDVLRDRVLKVGGALVKFLSGDFAGAAEDVKGAFTGIGDEIVGEFQQASNLKKELQAIDDAQRTLNTTRAEQNKLIADAKLKINDENLSYGERQKALEQVRQAEVGLAKQEEELARRRYEAIKAQNALSDSSKEALDQEAQAYQALQMAQQASLQKQKEIFDQQKALRDKQLAEAKANADFERNLRLKLITDEEELAEKQAEAAYKADLEAINALKTSSAKKNELRIVAEQAYNAQLQKIKEDQAKKDEEAAQAEADKDEEKRQKQFDAELANVNSLVALDQMKYEQLETITEQDLENTKTILDKKLELEIQAAEKAGASQAELQLIRETYASAELKLYKDVNNAKNALAEEQLRQDIENAQKTAAALGIIAQAAGETTAIGKVAAIAQAGINTYLSASEGYKSVIGIPVVGPALAPLAAAAAVALGLKQVQQIMGINAEVPQPTFAGGGVVQGMGSMRSDNVSALLSPGETVINARGSAMFRPLLETLNVVSGGDRFSGGVVQNGVDTTSIEMLNTLKNGNKQPVKAYVVGSQMTNQMMLDRQVKSRSLI
jgi:DNA repair exonuclease SbcCD ATPase subunit